MMIYEDILKAFHKNRVKYVVVGGIAFNLLGCFRATEDLDILVDMTDENLFKVVKILKQKKYYVKQPVDPLLIADEATRKDWIKNKNMLAFCFYKETGEQVDIIIESPIHYADAVKKAERVRVDKMSLPVISIDDLIKMKSKTGRDKDKFDVRELRKIKSSRGDK
jgi:predicted nucleotidyltransferase